MSAHAKKKPEPFFYTTPGGVYQSLYADMLQQPHLLIAGATGSGKSVIINGLICTALYKAPGDVQFILIDPKRVELADYKLLPHTLRYASRTDSILQALQYAEQVMEWRYTEMQKQGKKEYQGADIYVIIDELQDLMTTVKKQAQPPIQRLAQLGRAAHIHVIAATQCPLRQIIPTEIKVNFDSRVGLRTRSAQDSRNILGVSGCELLPRYGQGYYMTPEGLTLYNIPLIGEDEIHRLVTHWEEQDRQAKQARQADQDTGWGGLLRSLFSHGKAPE